MCVFKIIFIKKYVFISFFLFFVIGLKREPYRRDDAVRRSQRRRQENIRLSHAMDELDL